MHVTRSPLYPVACLNAEKSQYSPHAFHQIAMERKPPAATKLPLTVEDVDLLDLVVL
jgi:hypothetical protein